LWKSGKFAEYGAKGMVERALQGSNAAAQYLRERSEALGTLRKACISMFKMMVPGHQEARIERHRLYERFRDAIAGGQRLNVISLSFVGRDDLIIEGLVRDVQGRNLETSGMDLLVQREGSDAFLDPKQAIKVVRRKYAMMSLVNSMNMMMGRRSIFSFTLGSSLREDKLVQFCNLLSRPIQEHREDEEERLRKDMKAFRPEEVELFLTDHVVGQALRLPWRLKVAATLLRERLERGHDDAGAAFSRADELKLLSDQARILTATELRAWMLFGERFIDSYKGLYRGEMLIDLIDELDETTLAAVITSLLDTYHSLRREHLEVSDLADQAEADAQAIETVDEVLRLGSRNDRVGDKLLSHASALDRIQRHVGRARFLALAEATRAEDFRREAQEGQAYQELAKATSGEAWERALQQARGLSDPAYRAKALVELAERLHGESEDERARDLLFDALGATEELDREKLPILGEVLTAMLQTGEVELSRQALNECLDLAHSERDHKDLARGLMVTSSALMQAGQLPEELRLLFTERIMGDDLSFWGSPAVDGSLAEAVLGLVDPADPHAELLVRKLLTHTTPEVRQGTVRMAPFESETYRELLLSHLGDGSAVVRTEILERIGYGQDQSLGPYLFNHLRRHASIMDDREKRTLALNLARIHPERYLPIFNLMLGRLANDSPQWLAGHEPFPDDAGLQHAALEILYRLNSRRARRLLWEVSQRATDPDLQTFVWAWEAVKRQPYGEPELPRSRLDPEWTQEDDQDIHSLLRPVAERMAAEARASTPASGQQEPSGLLGRISRRARTLITRPGEEGEGGAEEAGEETPEAHAPRLTAVERSRARLREQVAKRVRPAAAEDNDAGPPLLLALSARITENSQLCNDIMRVTFRLYDGEATLAPLWDERHERVLVRDGGLEVVLGTQRPLPGTLPADLYLGVQVHGSAELTPRLRITREESRRR